MNTLTKRRAARREFHQTNLSSLPEELHRLTGWAQLTKFSGYSRDMQLRWIALDEFPKPEFHYIRIDDVTKFRKGVWRKVAIWDKRQVIEWFKSRGRL